MFAPLLTPIFLVLSLTTLLVHAGRGLNPMGPGGHWMGYESGHFYGQYQVAKDLHPSELKAWLLQVKDDMLVQMRTPAKFGVTAVPFAIAAYMGERGVLAVASSTGTGTHAEQNIAARLGAHFQGGESLAFLLPGGPAHVAAPGTLARACAQTCTALLAQHGVTDVYTQVRKRSEVFNA
jgi:hypothetical protein